MKYMLDKECNIISDEKKRLLLEELKKRLENIKDSYFDFVDAIIHYAKRKQEHLDFCNYSRKSYPIRFVNLIYKLKSDVFGFKVLIVHPMYN